MADKKYPPFFKNQGIGGEIEGKRRNVIKWKYKNVIYA